MVWIRIKLQHDKSIDNQIERKDIRVFPLIALRFVQAVLDLTERNFESTIGEHDRLVIKFYSPK